MLFVTNGVVVLVIDPVFQAERLQLTTATGQSLARGGTTEHWGGKVTLDSLGHQATYTYPLAGTICMGPMQNREHNKIIYIIDKQLTKINIDYF